MMKKNESKYFNTARLMNQALLLLLEKKEFEFITIKEICQKAGVNRSTFYLHYENIMDLFDETVCFLNDDFVSSFSTKDISQKINSSNPEHSFLIKEEFLIPYLEFVKRNKRVLKLIHNKPMLFKREKAYQEMKEKVFIPAMSKFNISDSKKPYLLEYFTRGVAAIISQWLEFDCKDDISFVVNIIIDCINFQPTSN
jgi:hypothetical protein